MSDRAAGGSNSDLCKVDESEYINQDGALDREQERGKVGKGRKG